MATDARYFRLYASRRSGFAALHALLTALWCAAFSASDKPFRHAFLRRGTGVFALLPLETVAGRMPVPATTP